MIARHLCVEVVGAEAGNLVPIEFQGRRRCSRLRDHGAAGAGPCVEALRRSSGVAAPHATLLGSGSLVGKRRTGLAAATYVVAQARIELATP